MDSLPEELLVLIFQCSLKNVAGLLELERVCKKFHRIANNMYLWYHLFKKIYPSWSHKLSFGYMKQPLVNWKSFLIELIKHQKQLSSTKKEPFYFCTKDYSIQEHFVHDIDLVANTGVVAVLAYTADYRGRKILFFNYPSFDLIREYKISDFSSLHICCSLIGIQLVTVGHHTVRLFSIALSRWPDEDHPETPWEHVLIYRLYDDGRVECLANIDMNRYDILGRDMFFFTANEPCLQVTKWLDIVCPQHSLDPQTVFLLVFGPKLYRYAGYGHVIQFNLGRPLMDPLSQEKSDECIDQVNDAKLIYSVNLGAQVSSMIHFRHCLPLSHLICTGNYEANELSIYDWRFGIKVGIIPWTYPQPWGFESSWAILPQSPYTMSRQELSMCGLRLVVVGDQVGSFVIGLLDMSGLLQVQWDPFSDIGECSRDSALEEDMPYIYSWWAREGTDKLRRTVLDDVMPYKLHQSSHIKVFQVDNSGLQDFYVAYNILQTSLYLLTDQGNITIMDMESSDIIKTVEVGPSFDINILGMKDVIVIGKDGLTLLKHE